MAKVLPLTRPPTQREAREAHLVVLDPAGWGEADLAGLRRVLGPPEVGVVVAAPAPGLDAADLAGALGALALLPYGLAPSAVAAAVEVAHGLRQRMAELLTARQKAQQDMADRDLVERAKNHLVANWGLKEAEAMRRLQQRARATGQPLAKVAAEVLRAAHSFPGPADAS